MEELSKSMYVLELWEYACPSFCSFSKRYFGSLDDMKRVAELAEESNGYQETVRALNDYFAGNEAATHNIVYRDIPVLTQAECLDERSFEMGPHDWIHMNIWNCEYMMHFEHADLQRILVRDGDYDLVCLRGTFRGLGYFDSVLSEESDFREIQRGICWGNQIVLAQNGDRFEMMLYVLEEGFEHDPDAAREYFSGSEIDFTGIMGDVFADG